MKNKLTLLFIIFITSTLFAQKDWGTLQKDNYSISYPKNWSSSNQKPQPTIQFVLMSEKESETGDNFRENINLNTEFLKGQKISIDDFTKISLDQIKAQVANAKIEYNEALEINNQKEEK